MHPIIFKKLWIFVFIPRSFDFRIDNLTHFCYKWFISYRIYIIYIVLFSQLNAGASTTQ
jgi:hypothetical protein